MMSSKVYLEVELKHLRDMGNRSLMGLLGQLEYKSLVNDNNINSVNNYK